MKQIAVLCFVALAIGCFRQSRVAGPETESSSLDVDLPGYSASNVSSHMTPVYDACLKRYGSFLGKKALCEREALLTSPLGGVWWCTGWWSYGYATANGISAQPRLCSAQYPMGLPTDK